MLGWSKDIETEVKLPRKDQYVARGVRNLTSVSNSLLDISEGPPAQASIIWNMEQ